MATKADSSSASAPKLNLSLDSEDISSLIAKLKEQVISDRSHFVKDKIEENGKKLYLSTNNNMSTPKSSLTSSDNTLLTERKANSLSLQNGSELHSGEKDNETYADEVSNAMISAKSPSKLIKLPEVLKLPPYTTWIFLDRNQRMPEDQSIVGRRRIYYDQSCGEALICSDSEEEVIEDEEEKKEFGTGEDFIIWNTIQETGISDAVLEFLGHYFGRKPLEIQERYDSLQRIKEMEQSNKSGGSKEGPIVEDLILEKDLESALDSFDNLFCRRCLVFDCRLHGCSQDLVFPTEKQAPWSLRDEGVACSNQCFLLAGAASSLVPSVSERPTLSSMSGGIQLNSERTSTLSSGRKAKSHQSENISSNANLASDSSESEVSPRQVCLSPVRSTSPSKVKPSIHTRNRKRVAEKALTSMKKKQKKTRKSRKESTTAGSQKPDAVEGNNAGFSETDAADCSKKEEFVDENTCKPETDDVLSWKDIEKSLFTKGVEIFGKNSCLIARNLLNGMKTCAEVFQYICFIDNKSAYRSGEGMDSRADGCKGADYNGSMGTEFRRRSRFLRRRGRVRRLKYTWKQSGYHSTRKRISERKDQPCRQYNPCGCQTACGKQCPCLVNGTCCEKYCGCPKICKNRFRGCHCAKSQCRSRQCPCFAANRECDPDVCRNCWVGCGDGSLGGPTQRGDNYECRNMKLLLKQQQRVLLGRSDVSGWGAFLKNSVNKHEYLGEYTGELISHREADKRGKIYDRENSSFLFNLNDQFVLDAYRKGDKLKFANHSPDPNCYAKVIMVAGDHRVGIFAKERINAGEELFYDYRYEPDRAPAWARKPETSTMKKDEPHSSTGRAKKLA